MARCRAEVAALLTDEEAKDELDCPAGIVGRIIGRGGETIRALQSASGVRVCSISRPASLHLPSHVAAKSLALCCSRTFFISRQPLAHILRSSLPAQSPPPPLLQAHITVDQNYPEGQPRKIIVQGRPDACKKASVMIRELINGEPGSAQAIIQRVCQEVCRASASCSGLPPPLW